MALSRIGKKPVTIPSAVKVSVDGNTVRVEGPKGSLERSFEFVSIETSDGKVSLEPVDESRDAKARHGLARSLIQNMVTGVSTGFRRDLEITGVGYRADVKGRTLEMALGYSHPIQYELPEGVNASVEKQTKISLESADKELLGLVAAKVRGFRPPDPYKAKGVRYSDEQVRRKAGKTGSKK